MLFFEALRMAQPVLANRKYHVCSPDEPTVLRESGNSYHYHYSSTPKGQRPRAPSRARSHRAKEGAQQLVSHCACRPLLRAWVVLEKRTLSSITNASERSHASPKFLSVYKTLLVPNSNRASEIVRWRLKIIRANLEVPPPSGSICYSARREGGPKLLPTRVVARSIQGRKEEQLRPTP